MVPSWKVRGEGIPLDLARARARRQQHHWPLCPTCGRHPSPFVVLCPCLSDTPDIQKSERPGKEGKRQQAAMSSFWLVGAGCPCGTLFPWRGPGLSGGHDFRAGDSLLAVPGDGGWVVVHSSHAPLSPGDVRTRTRDLLSPSYSPGEAQAQCVTSCLLGTSS